MAQYLKSPGDAAPITDVIQVLERGQYSESALRSLRSHIDRGREEYKGDKGQRVAPATGMPAITVPTGASYGTLPAGFQILGRPYAEGILFRYAFVYEKGTHHHGDRSDQILNVLPGPD